MDVPAELRIRAGADRAGAILAEARNGHHGIVVLGGPGQRSEASRPADEITRQVLARANCAVLVVPSEE